MAKLKRGSKGKEVEALQTRLNKLGTKPVLKVDGIFGPITHKALVAFQKKAKLKKPDGVVGTVTEAALKMGGPLPVMKVHDMSPAAKIIKDCKEHNLLLNGYMMALDGALFSVDKILDKQLPIATKMVSNNKPLWEELSKLSKDITTRQKDFKAIRLSDPIKASKLSKECDTIFAKVEIKADAIDDNIDTLYDSLDKTVKDLSKGVSDIQKMMGFLKKHVKKGERVF